MMISHVKPEGWQDTTETGKIQPSEVAGLVHVVEDLAVNDVAGLQVALDGKAASGHSHTLAALGAAAVAHAHAIADVTGLQVALDGKAASGHSHTLAALGAAAVAHAHAIADVTGLQVALDGKAASGHSHSTMPAGFVVQREGGAEGGQFVIQGGVGFPGVNIDVYANSLRFWRESDSKGVSIDLSVCKVGVGSHLSFS